MLFFHASTAPKSLSISIHKDITVESVNRHNRQFVCFPMARTQTLIEGAHDGVEWARLLQLWQILRRQSVRGNRCLALLASTSIINMHSGYPCFEVNVCHDDKHWQRATALENGKPHHLLACNCLQLQSSVSNQGYRLLL